MARVTICIPTYRRTRWLAGAIASALAQTYPDVVVEVHDDASPGDAVAEVVARFDDPRLRLVRHATNVGIVGNFTRSLLAAQTDYVLQIGDDDEAHPRLVEATVAALDRFPTAGLAHTRFALIDEHGAALAADQDWLGTPSPPLERGQEFVARSMRHGCRVCSSTALIRRAAVPPGGFLDADFPQFDFAFWLRMAEHWDVAFVAEPLGRYRIHPHSHTSALSDITEHGYLQQETTLRQVHAVKRRHAATLPPGPRRGALERAADRALRRELVSRVREQTLPERPFKATARGLAGAARREPALLLEPATWSLLAGSVLGPRAVEKLKGRP
ncbi:MAG TPA: glycosyltransferase [Solirubrobacter sp.]|nr:glycosyltransferase [Solirubrobacter sp.]